MTYTERSVLETLRRTLATLCDLQSVLRQVRDQAAESADLTAVDRLAWAVQRMVSVQEQISRLEEELRDW